jgi:hypothetical protein
LLTEDSLSLKKELDIDAMKPEKTSWSSFSIGNFECIQNNKVLIGIKFHESQVKYAIYIFDTKNLTFNLISEVNTHTRETNRYFETRAFKNDSVLMLYYTGQKRQSAEIYHNYYNHILLINENFPQGIELIKLGIDTGNVKRWGIIDKTLYLETLDNRDQNKHKVGLWSLNLSNFN